MSSTNVLNHAIKHTRVVHKVLVLSNVGTIHIFLFFGFVMLYCLFTAALWSPIGKELTSWLSCVWLFIVFCHFSMWCPGSGVVLECVGSWSLPPYLHLAFAKKEGSHSNISRCSCTETNIFGHYSKKLCKTATLKKTENWFSGPIIA